MNDSWLDSLGSLGTTFGKVWSVISPPAAVNANPTNAATTQPKWLPWAIGGGVVLLVVVIIAAISRK